MAARSDDSALLSLTLSLLARDAVCLAYSGRLGKVGSDDDWGGRVLPTWQVC